MKHKRGLIIGGSIVGILAIAYVATSLIWQSNQTFLANTQVAGVDVSGKTATQAAPKVSHALEHRTYHIVENGKAIYSFNSKSAGITVNTKQELKQLVAKQNYWSWPVALLQSAQAADTSAVGQLSVSNSNMQALLKKITNTANSTKRTKTENAKLIYQNGKVVIKKEVQGTELDQTTLKKVVSAALADGKTSINLKDAYVKPTLTSTSSALKTAQSKSQKYATETATYNINGHKFTIPHDLILSWIKVDSSGNVTLDQTKVLAYVKELNAKYHTYHTTRTFKSTKRGTVKVSGGFYGWTIKTTAEAKALSKQILAGKSFTRSPLINGSGYNNNKTDIGNTYVEVDKENQHMWVYVDGKLKVSTDVVTGKPGKHATTTGVWYIWSKQKNATLKGDNDDGSSYSQPVSYWMPFDNTGEGIHDSSWQKQYGGTWYKKHGSHGCVNTPPSVMSKVYAAVPTGTPVIVF
ncbi:cell surface protein [Lactiplantibacillus fabifermentans T30PCM01]|uniref:Cell surface protein n=1 Tax=Lactiplantibacillus fabifermentans T30PCM01 TaxID=1400520 RepID=W6TA13_9LACO|nr:peptidoglycan binding domain-containing protein [Lactiplantibacillus fabifermentans]ETY75352.1 cell surface protein [Lactiplantibacillus fabifermentans T30PCM01]